MTATTSYTTKELDAAATFLARMAPFLAEGRSFEQAGRAVLDRDAQLVAAALRNGDDRNGDVAQALRAELARQVWVAARKPA